MSLHATRRRALGAAAALGLAGWLPPARACEFFTGHLRVTHPWTRATLPGARSAVLCMRFDEIVRADRLVGVRTPVARGAEMGGPRAGEPVDLALPAGSEIELAEEGLHLRLTGLTRPLQVGREFELELNFERAGTLFATLSVDFTAEPAPTSFTTRRFL